MSLISRTAVLAALAAIAVAGPTYAQPIGTSDASSSVRPTQVAMHQVRHRSISTRQNGFNAFAMVPAIGSGSALSPALTGGGSVGYNENLRNDRW